MGNGPVAGEAAEAREVRADSVIIDVLRARPDAARVLYQEFGLPCVECELRWTERLGEGVALSGLDPARVVARLNACPPRTAAPPPAAPEGGGAAGGP